MFRVRGGKEETDGNKEKEMREATVVLGKEKKNMWSGRSVKKLSEKNGKVGSR